MGSPLAVDMVVACADLVQRAGARYFELGWTCPHVPGAPDDHTCPDVTWHAHASYQGARILSGEHAAPSLAALALAERLLRGATCRCLEKVALSDDQPGCRWRLVGQRWEPGCDAEPLHVTGKAGDHAAIQAAVVERGNRQARRAAKRRKGGAGRG